MMAAHPASPDLTDLNTISASCKWTCENAEEILSVRYVRAPFGPLMPGKDVNNAYVNLLDHSNSIIIGIAAATPAISPLLSLDEYLDDTHTGPRVTCSSTNVMPTTAAVPSQSSPELIKEYNEIFEVVKPFSTSHADSIFLTKRRRQLAAEKAKVKKLRRGSVLSTRSDTGTPSPGPAMPASDSAAVSDGVNDEDDAIEEPAPLAVLKCNIEDCIEAIQKAKLKILEKKNLQKYSSEYITRTINRYGALSRFMSDVNKLLIMLSSYDVVTMLCLDEGFFTQLFINFGWIFAIEFRLVSSFERLVVCDKVVSSQPDVVLMEKGLVRLIVTVVEIKKDVVMISDHGHDTRKRKLSGYSDVSDCDRDDIAYLPNNLRGRHACQLVRALPLTNAKNRMCMLGMIVQETKVRLTCLMMRNEHQKSLKLPNYDPANYSAKIFYTRAYDMLNADDRKHLINIMATLAS